MTETVIHVGDVGTIIRLTITEDDGITAVDVSAAIVKKYFFAKPDGTKINKTVEFDSDGKDGKLKYTTVSGDMDMSGEWLVQAYVEIDTAKYYSSKTAFAVHGNLA